MLLCCGGGGGGADAAIQLRLFIVERHHHQVVGNCNRMTSVHHVSAHVSRCCSTGGESVRHFQLRERNFYREEKKTKQVLFLIRSGGENLFFSLVTSIK